jgi:hypothetical protein
MRLVSQEGKPAEITAVQQICVELRSALAQPPRFT